MPPSIRTILVGAHALLLVACNRGPDYRDEQIQALVRSNNHREAYRRLVESPRWSAFLEDIRKANPKALEVASSICPDADTDPGEELLSAVAATLAIKPSWVLSGATKCPFGVEDLCGWCSAHDPDDMNPELLLRRTAVESVSDPKLSEAKAACLRGLDAALRH